MWPVWYICFAVEKRCYSILLIQHYFEISLLSDPPALFRLVQPLRAIKKPAMQKRWDVASWNFNVLCISVRCRYIRNNHNQQAGCIYMASHLDKRKCKVLLSCPLGLNVPCQKLKYKCNSRAAKMQTSWPNELFMGSRTNQSSVLFLLDQAAIISSNGERKRSISLLRPRAQPFNTVQKNFQGTRWMNNSHSQS